MVARWISVVGCLGFAAGAVVLLRQADSTFVLAQDAPAAAGATADAARDFDAHVAPLLAKHCLECHDATSRKGGLDLSARRASLAGGDSGEVIVPGKANQSLLWEYVDTDQMPPKGRPRLSPEEKQRLRHWIDQGAVWSAEAIDPLAYHRDQRAAMSWIARLTVPEYIETVRSTVGVDIAADARRLLPPDQRADGFSNTAYNLNVDLAHIEAYARLAQIIVSRMDVMAFAAEHVPRDRLKRENMREIVGALGKWLLRGPLEEHEINTLTAVADAVAKEGGDLTESLRYVVEAMVQSPRFVYRMERQLGGPVDERGTRQLDNFELASRISYILWGGPPDRDLLRAAEQGKLADRAEYEAQVERMLKDSRAVERSARFIEEWLHLDRLATLRPDVKRFPKWDPQLAADMREETLAYFKYVAWEQNRPLADLLNAQVVFATPRLAAHYGLSDQLIADSSGAAQPRGPNRTSEGLVALYTFQEGGGNVVRDVSAAGEPLDLTIDNPAAVSWSKAGLSVNSPALLSTAAPARRLIEAVKKSSAITIEAWITPADVRQTGPARVVSLSSGASQRNFTIGQDGDKYEFRFRTTARDNNGQPALTSRSGAVQTKLTHVVYTRGATGTGVVYINGEEQEGRNVEGRLTNWDDGFHLVLANETSRDRPWRGTYHLVAIYNRALTADEVRAQGTAMARYDVSGAASRGGLLTHASVLTVGGDDASMVTRGLFVLQDLLYSGIGNPPPDADTTPVPSKPGVSNRAVAEIRLANKACTGCHSKFEPFAFALEKFDGIGGHHESDEHGNKLRDDGQIVLPGQEQPVSFGSSAELMDLLASSERVRMNFTRKVTQFAIGRPLVESDGPILDQIHQAAQQGGGTYAALIKAIVLSDLVRRTRVETAE
jgi:hypothetical protein